MSRFRHAIAVAIRLARQLNGTKRCVGFMRRNTPPLSRFEFALSFAEVGCPARSIPKFNVFCKEKFQKSETDPLPSFLVSEVGV
jgi:hypothetical protein